LLKLTKKADYALMAMKHLAEHSSEGSRSAKDVADAYGIPPEALAKILQRLAKAGLLHRSTAPTADTRWLALRIRFRHLR
jgi:DNA-binding IscR family transcriptional regulator